MANSSKGRGGLRASILGTTIILLIALQSSDLLATAALPLSYQRTEEGLTYSRADDHLVPEHYPDLVAVCLGFDEQSGTPHIGYVRGSELERAEGAGLSPDEAVRFTQSNEQEMALAFAQAVSRRLPDGQPISADQARDLLSSLKEPSFSASASANLLTAYAPGLSAEEAQAILLEATEEALSSTGTAIPAYALDGVTELGTYRVGGW